MVFFALAGCQKQATAGDHVSLYKDVISEDTKVGTGEGAKDGDLVLFTYEGKFPKDGKVFDTNDPVKSEKNKNPLAVRVNQKLGIIKGLGEGIAGLKVGGERTIKIPWSKAYGSAGNEGGIPPYSDLIFEVKCLYVVKKGEESLIEVEDILPGTGAEVKEGDTVTVNYTCKLTNGRIIDDRSKPDKSVKFNVGRAEAISGFDKGIVGMKIGGHRRLTLGPDAGWGAFGKDVVAGNQVLVYDILSVKIGT